MGFLMEFEKTQTMKKISLLILIFCTQNLVLAQKKFGADDWAKILSGKIETYQAYNIKTIKLSNNGKIIKQIDYNPITNKLTANGEKDTVTYVFDRENRLVNANFSQSWYAFNYLENDKKANSFELKMNEDTLQNTRTISYPYPEKPKIEWFDVVKKSKKTGKTIYSSSKKYIINPKDSLCNHHETKKNKNFSRKYDNGATSQLNYISEKNYSSDSIYVRPNGIRFAKYEQFNDDNLLRNISVGDSLYNYHFKAGILSQKKISFENRLMSEYNYNPETGKLQETITHTYFPEKEYGGIILWKTEHQNFQTQKTEIIYPVKKKYKLKNNVLVERKKLNLRLNLFRKRQKPLECGTVRGCGGYAYDIKKIRPFYPYNIASTSVLMDNYFLFNNLDDLELSDNFADDDIQQSFIHSEMPLGDLQKSKFSGVYKTGEIPKTAQKELIRIAKRWYSRKDRYKDFKVEITTYDNKKFTCNPIPYLDQIHLPVDVFFYNGID